MADNYLERRMEELRGGRLGVKGGVPGIKPGSLRIVVAGGCSGKALEEVLAYRRKGYRVAVFDPDESEGRRMAYRNGVRYHHVALDDAVAMGKETENLLKVWRNIDIIIGDEFPCSIIGQHVAKWRNSLPIPDFSEVRIVILQ
ncbi:MAG: hypothetical protein K2O47_03960 [Muribaculaceae bacterium]|nr:hypothetical protein [Muribaculaceae bacterium]